MACVNYGMDMKTVDLLLLFIMLLPCSSLASAMNNIHGRPTKYFSCDSLVLTLSYYDPDKRAVLQTYYTHEVRSNVPPHCHSCESN